MQEEHPNQQNQPKKSMSVQLAKQLNAQTERGLHPKSWLFILFDNLSTLIIFFVVFVFNSFGDDTDAAMNAKDDLFGIPFIMPIAFGTVLILALAPIIHLLTFRFQVIANEIRIRWGVFNKQKRHIPLHKIHNVAIHQNLLHRIFNVAVVTLESAGSGQESEVSLKVVSYEDALVLEQGILDKASLEEDLIENISSNTDLSANIQSNSEGLQKNGLANNTDEKESVNRSKKTATLLTLPEGELIKYGLISNAGIAIGGILTVITSPDRLFMWIVGQLGVTIPEDAGMSGLAYVNEYLFGQMNPLMQGIMWLLVTLITIISMVVVGKVISIVSAFINLHQFKLTDNGEHVSIEKGLFTRKKSRVPVDKIQVWRVEESILHRWFNRQTLKLDTAILAGNPNGQGKNTERGISELVPLTSPDHLQQLLNYWKQPSIYDYEYYPVHDKAWRRLFFSWMVIISLVLPVLVWLLPSLTVFWLIVAVLMLIMGGFISKKRADNMGVVLTDTHLIWRDGWLNRTFCITEITHAHAIALTHSPFDRSYGMATLIIDTVGGTMLKARLTLPYLEYDIASDIAEDVRIACA